MEVFDDEKIKMGRVSFRRSVLGVPSACESYRYVSGTQWWRNEYRFNVQRRIPQLEMSSGTENIKMRSSEVNSDPFGECMMYDKCI